MVRLRVAWERGWGEKITAKYGDLGGFLTNIRNRSRSTEKLGSSHVGGWSSWCLFALEWTSLAWREEPVVLHTLKGSSVAADGGLWLRITAVWDGFAGPWDARPWKCRPVWAQLRDQGKLLGVG